MAVTPTPPAVLARRLRERDHDVWAELYAAYGPRLRAFALSLTRDPHEADDLVQETFVRALPRMDRLDADTLDMRAYLFTTLRNTFLSGRDRARRVAPVHDVPEPTTPGDLDEDPEGSLLLGRQIEEVRRASDSLPPRQRLALSLRELEDCSYAEIGVIIGLKENAVAQLISRARDSLRSALRLEQVAVADLPEDCRRRLPQLSRHLDGQLRGEQLEATLGHLGDCPACQEALASMSEASRRYRSLVPPPVCSDEAQAAEIDAQLTASGFWSSPPRRHAPPRARHLALGALGVLLILGGALALAARTAQDEPTAAAVPSSALVAGASAAETASTPARTAVTAGSSATPAGGSASDPSGARAAGPAATGTSASAAPPSAGTTPPRSARRTPSIASERGASARPQRNRSTEPKRDATAPQATTPASAPPASTTPAADPEPAPDTTAPSVEITSATAEGSAARFAFAASETNATFACALDGGGYEPCTSPKGYAGLPAGDHTFAVRASDQAGNTGGSDTHPWSVADPRPDLVVTALGDTGFTIANAGTAAAGAFVVTVTQVGTFTFGGLPSGATAARTWTCRRGTIDLIVDRSNAVAESDESNNGRTITARC